MAGKKIRIGQLIANKFERGEETKTLLSIGLGTKGKNPQYNNSVEIIVRDASGNVVAKQRDGFIELVDPRKQPDDLLSAGIINEETAEKMRNSVKNLPDKVRYTLMLKG